MFPALSCLSSLTDKDRKDMQFGLDHGVDWCALSFIQRPEDLALKRRLIAGGPLSSRNWRNLPPSIA